MKNADTHELVSALESCSSTEDCESSLLAYVKERKKKPDTILLVPGLRKKTNLPESILRSFLREVQKNL